MSSPAERAAVMADEPSLSQVKDIKKERASTAIVRYEKSDIVSRFTDVADLCANPEKIAALPLASLCDFLRDTAQVSQQIQQPFAIDLIARFKATRRKKELFCGHKEFNRAMFFATGLSGRQIRRIAKGESAKPPKAKLSIAERKQQVAAAKAAAAAKQKREEPKIIIRLETQVKKLEQELVNARAETRRYQSNLESQTAQIAASPVLPVVPFSQHAIDELRDMKELRRLDAVAADKREAELTASLNKLQKAYDKLAKKFQKQKQ